MSNIPHGLVTRRAARRARGFSVIELMIAVTLALIVTAGVMAAFLGSRSSFMTTTGTAAVSDNGRFALDFLQSAVRNAGYMACNTTHTQLSLLNAGPTPVYYNYGQPLGGYDANNTATYTLATPPVSPDSSAGDWQASTGPAWGGGGLDAALAGKVLKYSDVLVVYSTLRTNQPPAIVTSIANGASSFQVQNVYNLAPNQIAVIADCAKSIVFQISSVAGTTVSFGTSGTPGNTASSFPVSFQIGSQVTPIDTTVYYIGQGADGDGALFSNDLNATSTFTANELVSDIESMQVLYGVDTTGTQTVAEYMPAQQVIDFNTVMSVKLAVLAASQPGAVPKPSVAPSYNMLGSTVTAPIDTRARQVFEITVSTRNMEE